MRSHTMSAGRADTSKAANTVGMTSAQKRDVRLIANEMCDLALSLDLSKRRADLRGWIIGLMLDGLDARAIVRAELFLEASVPLIADPTGETACDRVFTTMSSVGGVR